MRALVLLCLLHAASAKSPYSWNGPVLGPRNPAPSPGYDCGADASSCSCCMMVREVDRLQTYFDSTLTQLERDATNTTQALETIKANRVAFTVSLYSGDHLQCYGPFDADSGVTYKHSFLNLGEAYDSGTGVFTVPYAGVYSLAVTSYTDAGSPGYTLAICASLQVNGRAVAGARDLNTHDKDDSATVAVALHLKVGDRVSVGLRKGCFLCDDNSHYNTFSAFLLYGTE
ncbi:complement C1q-like protein 2 [Cololabis saira]|uniref:complement C1q-like protein 2 n=1 Tax=Cololabis saira TaxID=129043 RepID=UPI002AD52853|nr:complement C1q-like protein 2 [Cololabis saira]